MAYSISTVKAIAYDCMLVALKAGDINGAPIQVQADPPTPPASDRRGEGVAIDASLPSRQETKRSENILEIEKGF